MNSRLLLLLSASVLLAGDISFQDLLQANRQPHNWLTYSGPIRPAPQPARFDYTGQRRKAEPRMGLPGSVPREV